MIYLEISLGINVILAWRRYLLISVNAIVVQLEAGSK